MSDFEKLLYGNYETPAPTETTPKLPSDTGKLSSSLFEASLTTPDAEVENSKFSELLGVPKTVLPKNAKQLAALKENTPEELQRTSPKTAAFLQNADNAKATGLDEIKNLKALEAAHASYTPDAISGFIKDYTSLGLNTPAQAAQKLTDMKQRGVDLTTLPRSKLYDNAGDIIADPIKSFAAGVNVMLSGGIELSRYNPSNRLVNAAIKTFTGVDIADETQAKLTQNFDYWQKQQSGALQATKEEFNKVGAIESMGMLVKNPALMVDQLAQSLPYLIPGGLAAQGGTKAMLAFNSISEAMDAGNSARQEAIAAGASPEQQNKSAALAALITMPLAFLGNWLVGTGKIEADFLTQGSTGHNLLSTMLREAFSGAMEEGGNTFGTNVGAKGYDPTRELFANVGKSAAVGGLLESVHGAGMSGLSKFLKDTNGVTVNNTEQTDKAAKATTAFSTLETLGAQAAESGLRGRSPELFQKFIEQMTEDSALTDVYVDAAVLSSVLEKNPTDWNVTAPDLALEVAQATANGGDARISVADYLTFVAGTPIEPAILQDLRTKPDGLTYKESTEFFQQQQEIFAADVERVVSQNTLVLPEAEYTKQKEAGATLPETYEQYVAEHANTRAVYEADVKTVEDKILGEFTKAARFTAPVNRSYTAPIVEFYKTQAKRFNMTPSKLFAEYPINIQSFLGRDGTNELSQPAPTTLEDFRPENLSSLMSKPNWAIMTAENPNAIASPEQNPEFMAKLKEIGRAHV